MSLFIELDGKLFFDLLQKALSRAFARRGLAGRSTKIMQKDERWKTSSEAVQDAFPFFHFALFLPSIATGNSFAKECKMQRRNNDKESSVPFSWVSSKLAGKISDRN